jgi:hypothetical protein
LRARYSNYRDWHSWEIEASATIVWEAFPGMQN